FTNYVLTIEPTTLVGRYIILRPPSIEDIAGLSIVARDGEIWNNRFSQFPNLNEIEKYIQEMLDLSSKGAILPFITIHKASNTIVGTTRYLNIDYENHRLEIGHTWIAKSWRKTYVNTEAKFLMLQYAFEKLACIAVEIRTDVLNTVSRQAIQRLGAKQDGILRHHRIMRDGRIRDTVCYSIIKSEWEQVKENLMKKLMKYNKQDK
ncbi:MAG: GNAT family protein, partial [Nitrososphaeraceae archaeon]|nr:GNAT family protein [Nitrososphaeraceae archaeon]